MMGVSRKKAVKDKMEEVSLRIVLHMGCEGQKRAKVTGNCPSYRV